MLKIRERIQDTRKDLVRVGPLKKDQKEMKELPVSLTDEIIFQAEGRASPKALRWKCPQCV